MEAATLLKRSGIPLYGAALRADTRDIRDMDYTRAAAAIGSEGRGLSNEVLTLCSATVKIPMMRPTTTTAIRPMPCNDC